MIFHSTVGVTIPKSLRTTDLDDKTISDWCRFCREVMVCWVFQQEKRISSENCIVEIDESKFGKCKYNVGRVIDSQWPVFGAICLETRAFNGAYGASGRAKW